MQSCAGLGHPMDPVVSVQNKNLHRKHREACKSSWSPTGILKSFILTFPWNSGKACEDLSWNHCTSTRHRSETNGIAERAVRRVKESTSVALLQSGLTESWWADSMECYTYLRNVTDLLSERRFGVPFKDRLFHLVHWLSIILLLRRGGGGGGGPAKNPSIWKESLTWIVPRRK